MVSQHVYSNKTQSKDNAMKYQVLVGSLVCFLMNGVVVGSDEGMTSRKFANLITRQGKASGALDQLKRLHPDGGPLVDAAEKKAEELELELYEVLASEAINELIKEAILGGTKTSETVVKYCFRNCPDLLREAWGTIGQGEFTHAIINHCRSTCIPDHDNADQAWISTYCDNWLRKYDAKPKLALVMGPDGELEYDSDGGESSGSSVGGTDDEERAAAKEGYDRGFLEDDEEED